jgi:hypothetical protein
MERTEGELVVTWNVEAWRKRCLVAEHGDPIWCSICEPLINKLLSGNKSDRAPVRHG